MTTKRGDATILVNPSLELKMNTTEVLSALSAGTLAPDEAVKKLIALGANPRKAREAVALFTGKTQGDVVILPNHPKKAKRRPRMG